jgi:hypothetical protein
LRISVDIVSLPGDPLDLPILRIMPKSADVTIPVNEECLASQLIPRLRQY